MLDLIAIARALVFAALIRALTERLPQPPMPPRMPMNDPLIALLARIDTPPDTAPLEMFRSDTEAGLWNRWYDGEDIGMDAPVGGMIWARQLDYEQVAHLAQRIREEYG